MEFRVASELVHYRDCQVYHGYTPHFPEGDIDRLGRGSAKTINFQWVTAISIFLLIQELRKLILIGISLGIGS